MQQMQQRQMQQGPVPMGQQMNMGQGGMNMNMNQPMNQYQVSDSAMKHTPHPLFFNGSHFENR